MRKQNKSSNIKTKIPLLLISTILLLLIILAFLYKDEKITTLLHTLQKVNIPVSNSSSASKNDHDAVDRIEYVKAPEFEDIPYWLNTNSPINISDLKGKVVMLIFWRAHCTPCIGSLIEVNILQEKYGEELQIIGVYSPKYEEEKEENFINNTIVEQKITYPTAIDLNMRTFSKYARGAWPSFVLIDRDGFIRDLPLGFIPADELSERIDKVL